MGRPRKPTAHLEIVGAFKAHPERVRDAEPQCDEAVGGAPEWLTKSQRKAWDYLANSASMCPGVLTKMDRAYLELCARALAGVWDYDETENNGRAMTGNGLSVVGKMLGKLGMTPSERSGVVVPRGAEQSVWDEFDTT